MAAVAFKARTSRLRGGHTLRGLGTGLVIPPSTATFAAATTTATFTAPVSSATFAKATTTATFEAD